MPLPPRLVIVGVRVVGDMQRVLGADIDNGCPGATIRSTVGGGLASARGPSMVCVAP